MADLPGLPCDVCRRPVEGVGFRWTRVTPSHGSLRLCDACGARFLERAEDRGRLPLDQLRLVDLVRALGGETWRVDDGLVWFREPIGYPPRRLGRRRPDEANARSPRSLRQGGS